MKIFPTKELKFRHVDDQEKSLNRLRRRTEKSKNLTSSLTDKSFRGTINGNNFKLISSAIGKGAFCVMSGTIESERGTVRIEIHKIFRIILSIFLCLPIIAIVLAALIGKEEPNPIFIVVIIVQIAFIRFVFIGLLFRFLAIDSLNRLRDVLDVEWIKN